MIIKRTDAVDYLIRERLIALGKNAKELGDSAGISPSHLSRFLQGEKGISRTKLLNLAEQLQISKDKMLYAAGFAVGLPPANHTFRQVLNIEQVYCNQAINAVIDGYFHLLDDPVHDALANVRYGKKDTLGLDVITESRITDNLAKFDNNTALITEETGKNGDSFHRHLQSNRGMPATIFIADPTDRSAQLEDFLGPRDMNSSKKVHERLNREGAIKEWEARFGNPASITGASSAVTCIMNGVPICTAIVNIITNELFVASRAGVVVLKLIPIGDFDPSRITVDFVYDNGRPISFRSFARDHLALQHMRHFTTFLGGVNKEGYKENFIDSKLLDEASIEKNMIYAQPGGPLRVLYLSTVQPASTPVGVIFANGEKIGEWIHWLAFLRFGKVEGGEFRSEPPLILYELYQEKPRVKDGILMSTSPVYSIFAPDPLNPHQMRINVEKFRDFENPSLVRSMLLMAPTSNTWANDIAKRNVFRPITF